MKIVLIRHGESEGNVDRNVYKTVGDNKVELTTAGIAQAAEAGLHLSRYFANSKSSITMYHSSWKRAKDTSILIKRQFTNIDIKFKNIECPLIHEQIYYSNLKDAATVPHVPYKEGNEFGAFWYQKPNTKVETYASVYQRALIFWNHIRLSHKNRETIIIVSHGIFLRVLEMVIKQLSIDNFEKLKDFDNCERRLIKYNKKTNTTK